MIFFLTFIVLSFSLGRVEGINCYSNHTKSVNVEGDVYCIYAQTEDGKSYQMCSGDAHYLQVLPTYPDSEMGECVIAAGYLKFMRCDTNWCNNGCDIFEPTTTTEVEMTTEQATTTSATFSTSIPTTTTTVASTTYVPTTTEEITTTSTTTVFKSSTTSIAPISSRKATTPVTVIVNPKMAPCETLANGTSEGIVDPNCETGKHNNKNGLSGQLPLTNVFDNKQVNVVYNIPAASNNCECRCGQNKAQNTFTVA